MNIDKKSRSIIKITQDKDKQKSHLAYSHLDTVYLCTGPWAICCPVHRSDKGRLALHRRQACGFAHHVLDVRFLPTILNKLGEFCWCLLIVS